MSLPRVATTTVVSLSAALAFGLAGAPDASAAPAPVTRQICVGAQHVRSGPSTSYSSVGVLRRGSLVSGPLVNNWIKTSTARYVSYRVTCAVGVAAPVTSPATRALMVQPTSTNGSPTSPFGLRLHPVTKVRKAHQGIDIGDKTGLPVYAAADGVVSQAAWSSGGGYQIKISHGTLGRARAVATAYLHNSRLLVKKGTRVKQGQLISLTGSTGLVTKPHLHFAVTESGTYVDPQRYLGPLHLLRSF